jgi:SAM-dependent methyltransferase
LAATTWGLGDYPLMAERLMPAARAVVDLAAVAPGERVLDVACGTGNAALLAAERGADVTGLDFEPALLEIARERTDGARFVEGDAAALPFDDAFFDATLSVFGVMYAPDHERAARELARVTKPGGRIVLAAWTPGSFMPRMGAALAAYLPPPPPGSGPPSRWGDENALAKLLPLGTAETRQLTIESDADFLIDTAGHVLAEKERLEDEGRWQALREDLRQLVGDRPEVELEYLLAAGPR